MKERNLKIRHMTWVFQPELWHLCFPTDAILDLWNFFSVITHIQKHLRRACTENVMALCRGWPLPAALLTTSSGKQKAGRRELFLVSLCWPARTCSSLTKSLVCLVDFFVLF